MSEEIEGLSLAMALAEGLDLTETERLNLLEQLAGGLHHAHRHGVIHRRITPDNVILGTAGTIRLTGFGHARLAARHTIYQAEPHLDVDTRYLAPEIMDPRWGDVDESSDLYSLAAIAAALWSGAPSTPGTPLPEEMPQLLRSVVTTMLSPTRTERSGTIDDLRDAISAAREPVSSQPDRAEGTGRAPLEFEPGDLIEHRYEVLQLLGGGAFSTVYRVHDTVELEDCALKLFSPNFGLEVVQREIRALRRIRHPNVVSVFYAGRTNTEPRQWYLVSEYVDGSTLAEFTERVGGRLPIDRAFDIGRQLLDALVAFHPDAARIAALKGEAELSEADSDELQRLQDAGLVHRDIKPQNIIYRPDGHVKLIDFNIASQAGTPVLTVSGTPRYQPADANLAAWDVTTDLFAVGIVLFELITGRHPYPNAQPGLGQPTTARTIDPGMPEAIAAFLDRASAPDRDDRYGTAPAMRAALVEAVSALSRAAAVPGVEASARVQHPLEPMDEHSFAMPARTLQRQTEIIEPGATWTFETFIREVARTQGERVAGGIRDIDRGWRDGNEDCWVSVGGGPDNKRPAIMWVIGRDDQFTGPIYVYTDVAHAWFQWGLKLFDETDRLKLITELNQIPGVEIPASATQGRPELPIDIFAFSTTRERLWFVMDGVRLRWYELTGRSTGSRSTDSSIATPVEPPSTSRGVTPKPAVAGPVPATPNAVAARRPRKKVTFVDASAILALAEENQVQALYHAALATADRFGLGARTYVRSLMLTPPQNRNRMLMNFRIDGPNQIGIDQNTECLEMFFGVPHTRTEVVLGRPGHYERTTAEALATLQRLESLLEEADTSPPANAEPGPAKRRTTSATEEASAAAPTERQQANVDLFLRRAEHAATLEFVARYVREFLDLDLLGVNWGLTVCPSGDRSALARLNIGDGCAFSIDRTSRGDLIVLLYMAETEDAASTAELIRSDGHTVTEEHWPRGPTAGYGMPTFQLAELFYQLCRGPIEANIDQACQRPLANRKWHNPLAGELLLDVMRDHDKDR